MVRRMRNKRTKRRIAVVRQAHAPNAVRAANDSPASEKLSHFLPCDVAKQLRLVSAGERLSKSSVIETSLRHLFFDHGLAERRTIFLRFGATLRRDVGRPAACKRVEEML